MDTLRSQTTLKMDERNGRTKQLREERKDRSQTLAAFGIHVHFLLCCSVFVCKTPGTKSVVLTLKEV